MLAQVSLIIDDCRRSRYAGSKRDDIYRHYQNRIAMYYNGYTQTVQSAKEYDEAIDEVRRILYK